MQTTLCDTASFVVRWMFVGGLMGRAARAAATEKYQIPLLGYL